MNADGVGRVVGEIMASARYGTTLTDEDRLFISNYLTCDLWDPDAWREALTEAGPVGPKLFLARRSRTLRRKAHERAVSMVELLAARLVGQVGVPVTVRALLSHATANEIAWAITHEEEQPPF